MIPHQQGNEQLPFVSSKYATLLLAFSPTGVGIRVAATVLVAVRKGNPICDGVGDNLLLVDEETELVSVMVVTGRVGVSCDGFGVHPTSNIAITSQMVDCWIFAELETVFIFAIFCKEAPNGLAQRQRRDWRDSSPLSRHF